MEAQTVFIPVLNRSDYFAGSDGTIYSAHSGIAAPLKPYLKKATRPAVSIQGKAHYVHILICTAFHGPRPHGKEVRHLDGNSLNNNPDNLCWGTRAENVSDDIQHKKRVGTPRRRMSEQTRDYIRKSSHLSTNELARVTGFTVDSIRKARKPGHDVDAV